MKTMTTADPAVLDRLVANHRQFLGFLERRVGSTADAEDILQDAFVKGLERGGQIDDAESAVAWFYRVLRNTLADFYRRRGSEDRALTTWGAREDTVEEPLDPALFDAVCRCALELAPTLPSDQADAIRQVDLNGLSVKEYAEAAGITPNNASVRLHRARRTLRTLVIECCGTCTDHYCVDCDCKRGDR